MTCKYFWIDPYLSRLVTIIQSVDGNQLQLESTVFFAFSGGQESDQGTIGDQTVLQAHKNGLDILYTMAENHGLTTGQQVEVVIDWSRRYRLMRLHFAAELVLELFYRTLASIEKVGAHIAADKARIDFLWGESISPLLPEICRTANGIIESNLEVRSAFSDELQERRYWEIDGFARVSCGGTHVRRTSEVGPVRLKRNNIGKGKERVEIYLAI